MPAMTPPSRPFGGPGESGSGVGVGVGGVGVGVGVSLRKYHLGPLRSDVCDGVKKYVGGGVGVGVGLGEGVPVGGEGSAAQIPESSK